ncbi:MAG: DUF1385 domain-containing protein [Candidatus Woesearchaeota archaeon]
MPDKFPVGGQGVIEGVMMKSPNYISVSVRNDKGKIVSMNQKLKKKGRFAQFFFIRGIYNLIEMLFIGVKALIWSGNQFTEEDEDLSTKDVILLLIVSFGFAVLFFWFLPYALTLLIGIAEEEAPFSFNLIDGIIKIALFIGYVLVISQMKDIKRIFKYHGAEHMAVHCYEHNEELTVKNVRKYKTLHTRCGSSFIMIVLIFSILLLSLIPPLVIQLYPNLLNLNFWYQKLILFPIRILAIPIIAGLSYELLKMADKFKKFFLFSIISQPGLWLQMLTTAKPDDSMIEVAINSLKNVLNLEKSVK